MKDKIRVWATGIFEGEEGAYTLSTEIPHIMSGKQIQAKLRKSVKGNKDKLVKVLLTKDTHSPMEWWAHSPATLNKDKNILWGDGEGRMAEWWPREKVATSGSPDIELLPQDSDHVPGEIRPYDDTAPWW